MKTLSISCIAIALAVSTAFAQTEMRSIERQPGVSAKPKQAATDASFVKKTMRSALFEVAAAELAATNTENPKVQKLARNIASLHDEARQQLLDIASASPLVLPEKPSKAMRLKIDRLAQLKGNSFDALYSQEMIDSHTQDIALFEMVEEKTENPELKKLIGTLLPKLREHLTEARAIITAEPPQPPEGVEGTDNASMTEPEA